MTVEKLMIGDLVRIKNNVESDAYFMHEDMYPGQCVKVEEVLSNGINPDWCGGEINDYLPDDAIEPIPLTYEILEANGFVNIGQHVYQIEIKPYYVWWESDRCRFGVDIDQSTYEYEDFGFVLRLPIQYVHELQHALRLCGIEKKLIISHIIPCNNK